MGLWGLLFVKLRTYTLLFPLADGLNSQLARSVGGPQPFTSMYLATFPFFSFRSSTAPCSTPSV